MRTRAWIETLTVFGCVAAAAALAGVVASPARSAAAALPPYTCTVGFTATNNTSSGHSAAASSFTACDTGRVTSIEIQYTGAPVSGRTLQFFNGQTVSGSAAYTQTGVSLPGTGFSPVALSGGFSVVAGGHYTFQINEGDGIGYNYAGLPGESAWFSGFLFSGMSVGFQIHILRKLHKV